MTLHEKFNMVDTHGKANLIWENGEFLITISYYRQKVNLYALEGFYAEIFYSRD